MARRRADRSQPERISRYVTHHKTLRSTRQELQNELAGTYHLRTVHHRVSDGQDAPSAHLQAFDHASRGSGCQSGRQSPPSDVVACRVSSSSVSPPTIGDLPGCSVRGATCVVVFPRCCREGQGDNQLPILLLLK